MPCAKFCKACKFLRVRGLFFRQSVSVLWVVTPNSDSVFSFLSVAMWRVFGAERKFSYLCTTLHTQYENKGSRRGP